jgi:beta-glucosidase
VGSVGKLAMALVLVLAAAPASFDSAVAAKRYPFQNPRLPLDTRVDDLVARLTLDEKISLLHQFQPAIPRLGIKAFKTGTEALHGLAWSTDRDADGAVRTATATVFPQAIGLASTWNPALIRRVGSVVGDELRGYNTINPRVWGLQVWSPVVDLLRDPRWGYSEDPFLTGTIATAYGSGLQGDHRLYLKVAPVLKHFYAYNNEVRRDVTSSNVRPRLKHEYYQYPFRATISSDAGTGVMASYNLVNGRPNHVSPDLDEDVRSWTDRTLYNVADAFGPYNVAGSEDYYDTNPEAFAAQLEAGLDSFTVDGQNSAPTIAIINEALDQGFLTEAEIDESVRHLLSIRFRLGEFDPDGGPYAAIGPEAIDTPQNRDLAHRTATEAVVLLKNDDAALPLDADAIESIAVVGPLMDTLYTDWYSGAMPYQVTPLDGITEKVGDGASIAATEAVDRIALRHIGTGEYVTATGTADADHVRLQATSPVAAAQFDVFDWGNGVLTLSNVENRKVLGWNWTPFVTRDDQPNGWFVQQQFKLEEQPDGTYFLRYVGYETRESWFWLDTYVIVDSAGELRLREQGSSAEPARFSKEVLRSGVDEAVAAATGADAAVVVVGSMPFINGREAHDRTFMHLAEGQQELIRAVLDANPNTVLVIENSYPTTINWEQEHVPAILWTTHAGQETGHALADVLFGENNPAGRLTQTWYGSHDVLPDILEYDIVKTNRTYLYFDGDILYPFGHGLSYTTFDYDRLHVTPPVVNERSTLRVRVDVTNTGALAGDEVVQVYTRQHTSRDELPLKQLRAFERIHLAPGETRRVTLEVPAAELRHWDVTRGRWVLESSALDVLVGASSADIRQQATVRLLGEVIPLRDLSLETRAIDFDDYAGVELVDETRERGDAVEGSAGGWLRFSDADLGSGVTSFTARSAREAADSSTIEVRLDDPFSGPLIGTLPVASTGDRYSWSTASVTLAPDASGRHDVYLVFGGELRLATFSLR